MKNVDFKGTSITRSDFSYVDMSDAEFGPIKGSYSYYNNNITYVNFSNANLSNAVFTQPPNLSGGLRINPIEFRGCDFTNANLEGTDGFSFYPNCIFKNTTMPDGTIRTDPEP